MTYHPKIKFPDNDQEEMDNDRETTGENDNSGEQPNTVFATRVELYWCAAGKYKSLN
jgi:ABC-type uncharacterized transport system substrate-binding protein